MPCPRCGCPDRAPLQWQIYAPGLRHIREACAGCGRWIRWAPQTPEACAEADRQPPAPDSTPTATDSRQGSLW